MGKTNSNNSAAKTQKASSSKPKATSQPKTASTQKTTSQAKSTTSAKSNTCSKTTTTTTQKSNNSTTQTATASNKKTMTTTTTTCSAKNASNPSLNSNSRNTNYSNVNNSRTTFNNNRSSQNQTSKGVSQAKTIDNRTNVNDSRGLQNQTSKGIPQSRTSRLNNNVTSLNNNKNGVVNNNTITSKTSIYQNPKSNINYSLPKSSGGYYTSPNYSVNKPTYVRNTSTTYKGNTNINYSLPKKGGGYYSSPNYSIIRPTYARNNSCIASIKTGSGRTNINGSSYVHRTNLNNTSVESFNLIDNMSINFKDIDLSKISPSAYDATNGKFVNVNSDIWKNAQLNITKRDDGTYLIKNGDIPLGFTVGDGISLFNTSSKSKKDSISNDSVIDEQNSLYQGGNLIGSDGNLKLSDLNLDRLSKTEDGAYNGNFTNLNLASYKNSKLSYDIMDNGVVSIKNGNKILGYTDVLGVTKLKDKSYYNTNINSSGFMDYLANTNINLSASKTSMKDVKEKYTNETIKGAIDNFYASNYENIELNTDGKKFVPYDFEKFLEEKGTSVEEFNNAIKAVVEKEGLGTREGVVASVEALIKGLAQYDCKLPYISSIDSDASLGKYNGYGIDSDWGTNGSWYTSTYSYNNHHYNQLGLDCSGLVSWAIHNGGYKYLGYNSTGYHENFKDYSSSEHKGQAGDLLWHSGHIMMIMGEENGNYLVAEEGGGDSGLVISKKPLNTSDRIIDMSDFYNDSSNLDIENY